MYCNVVFASNDVYQDSECNKILLLVKIQTDLNDFVIV